MTYFHSLHICGALAVALFLHAGCSPAGVTDTLVFGAANSEKAHAVSAENSDILTGGLGQPARQFSLATG